MEHRWSRIQHGGQGLHGQAIVKLLTSVKVHMKVTGEDDSVIVVAFVSLCQQHGQDSRSQKSTREDSRLDGLYLRVMWFQIRANRTLDSSAKWPLHFPSLRPSATPSFKELFRRGHRSTWTDGQEDVWAHKMLRCKRCPEYTIAFSRSEKGIYKMAAMLWSETSVSLCIFTSEGRLPQIGKWYWHEYMWSRC